MFRVFNDQTQTIFKMEFPKVIVKTKLLDSYNLRIKNFVSATEEGSIIVQPNFPDLSTGYVFEEIYAHVGKITSMAVSPDSKYIFTGGEDGILFVFAVSELLDHKTAIKGSFAAVKAEKASLEELDDGDDKIEVRYVEDEEEHYHHETIIDTQLADVVLLRR